MSTYHLNLLTLLELDHIGRRTIQQILLRPQGEELMHEKLSPGSPLLRIPVHPVSAGDLQRARSRAQAALEQTQESGMKLAAYGEDAYPSRLAALPDFPVILFLRGNPEAIHERRAISITGSRSAGNHAQQITESFARKLSEFGWQLVSGLTEGVEAAAHRGSLQAEHPGTAVLASGLDHVHPRKSKRLAQEILDAGGCWISEQPNGTRARRRQLIDRDRIRSALSAGVILIQESFTGHAMHTVRFASTQRRPLAALHPGHRAIRGDATGNNFLVKANAAVPLRSEEDLEMYLKNLSRHLADTPAGSSRHTPPQPVPIQMRLWDEP